MKIDRAVRMTLAGQPYVGRYFPARNCFRHPVAATPFVIYYQIRKDQLVVVAIRHGA